MCRGKEPLSRARAHQVARRMRKRKRKVQAYPCKFCGQWHVGNNGRKKHDPQR